ncbi:MAG: cell division ATP-binding protein FtsE [Gemmatimonadota bacterium]
MTDTSLEPSPLIVVDHVQKRYRDAPAALDDVSFTVSRGQFVLVTGPSGAGKSTLLRLLAALESPSAGRIVIAETDTARLNRRGRAALRRTMGVVPQDLLLLPDRSALENVMLPALVTGLSRAEARSRAEAALARVGVAAFTERPRALSGGAQQRVALARAIVNRPAVILADEPTAHLDSEAAAGIVRLLDDFSASGIAVLLASHGESVALPTRARVLRLANGRVAT